MKRLTTTFALIFSLMLFASAGFAQQTDTEMAEKKQHMMEMMQDSTMRAMMMEYMAENPEMRKQMMQQKMMDNPEMKERMQKHMKMMQAMMEGKEMDHSKMKQMMGDSSMMKMHMMCMQMMQDGMMDKDGMKSGKDNHEQHHN